jgi:hypothetical protein
MLIIKETLAYTKDVNDVVLSYAKTNNYHFAWVDRPLEKDEEGNLIEPISEAEVQEGHRRVRAYLYATKADPIFFRSQRGEATLDEWNSEIVKIKQDWQ